MDRLGVPIAIEALEHDALQRHAARELERPGADRIRRDPCAGGFECLGRHHHAGTIGEDGEQGRIGLREAQDQRLGIRRLDRRDRFELRLAPALAGAAIALEICLGGQRVEAFAVVEQHVAAQLEPQGQPVRRPRPAARELRHELDLLVDVDQLVAERGEDDAPGEARAGRRIERIGIGLQPDAQARRLSLVAGDQQQRGERRAAHYLLTP